MIGKCYLYIYIEYIFINNFFLIKVKKCEFIICRYNMYILVLFKYNECWE